MRGYLTVACLALALVACGSDIGGGAGAVCTTNDAPEACDTTCSTDVDCAGGFYCLSGKCSADCTQETGCAANQFCSERGRCYTIGGPDPDAPDSACPAIAVTVTPVVPTVMFLVDLSGSMTEDFPANSGISRWQAVDTAINDGTNGVIVNLEGKAIMGTTLYNSIGGFCPAGSTTSEVIPCAEDGPDAQACPNLYTVPAAPGNRTDIATLFGDNAPARDTPTAESLDLTYQNFPTPANPDSPLIVILATDGNPDSCVDPDANGDPEPKLKVEEYVEKAYNLDGANTYGARSIKTYALSVGEDVLDTDHLNRVANLGLGKDKDTGGETAFIATDTQALIDQFQAIITGARVCEFGLNGAVSAGAAEYGEVTLNGNDLSYGTDWQLKDDRTLELIDEACQTFIEAAESNLSAVFPCGTVEVIVE